MLICKIGEMWSCVFPSIVFEGYKFNTCKMHTIYHLKHPVGQIAPL